MRAMTSAKARRSGAMRFSHRLLPERCASAIVCCRSDVLQPSFVAALPALALRSGAVDDVG